jgi:hypothetical protein
VKIYRALLHSRRCSKETSWHAACCLPGIFIDPVDGNCSLLRSFHGSTSQMMTVLIITAMRSRVSENDDKACLFCTRALKTTAKQQRRLLDFLYKVSAYGVPDSHVKLCSKSIKYLVIITRASFSVDPERYPSRFYFPPSNFPLTSQWIAYERVLLILSPEIPA